MRHPLVLPSTLLLLLGVPLLWALASVAASAFDASAWQGFIADPQTPKALLLTLWTGLASTLLSMGLAAWLLSRTFPGPLWARLVRVLGPLLAVPHAAFAIGLAALIAPSGWLLRLASPWATGFTSPPAWATTQDPLGLGLIAVLVAKEVPFLLWAAATQLQRADESQRLTRELTVACTMGYTLQRAWWRVLWPQLWPRLRWPMLAVLAYSLTVVDVALVIGPTSPPTLSVLAWRWLLDADLARNAQGAVAAWWLAAVLALASALLWRAGSLSVWRKRWTNGERGRSTSHKTQTPAKPMTAGALLALPGLYLTVMLALAVGSVSGVWAFPALWPQTLTTGAWASVWASVGTVGTTLTLALASSAAALVWSVAWLECAPPRWDALARRFIYLPLVLPAVLWVSGVHAVTLRTGLDATWVGLWLAHTLATVPYVLIALSPAYLGFDARYWHISASLGKRRSTFLMQVK